MPKESKNKNYLGICVDRAVFEEIERRRGLVKRSTYVNDLLKGVVTIALGKKEMGSTEEEHNG